MYFFKSITEFQSKFWPTYKPVSIPPSLLGYYLIENWSIFHLLLCNTVCSVFSFFDEFRALLNYCFENSVSCIYETSMIRYTQKWLKINYSSYPVYCEAGYPTQKNKLFKDETSMRVEFYFLGIPHKRYSHEITRWLFQW